jgi:RNA polymerase sigma-70 factor (ECF subfamily)
MASSQSVAVRDQDKVKLRPAPEDEARLLQRMAAGDRRAFERLYRIYHPRLTRFLSSLVRRPEVVEEVLNDTLMAVWRKPDSFNGASKVSTWIFAIAYRKALRARSKLDEPVEDKDAEGRPSEEPGPEQSFGARQIQKVVLDAMNGLSQDHRTVIDLTYFHEFGYREIAEIMACPVDTVKTRAFHARRNLKEALSGSLADWL